MSARPSVQRSAVRKNAPVKVRTDKGLVRDLQVARRRFREREPPRMRSLREPAGLRAPSLGAAGLKARNPPKPPDPLELLLARTRLGGVSDR
jgi:hypothetical protein